MMRSISTCARFLKSLLSRSVLTISLLALAASVHAETFSGSWYNPDRDGEGFHIEILEDNQAMVIWFTYPGVTDDAEAEQAWILGTGTISDNTITILDAFRGKGPEFGENYDKDDFNTDTWGDVTITFTDDDNGQIDFDGNDGFGSTSITRVTSIVDTKDAGGLPNGISGAWYNEDTNGQGWFVEIISKTNALVYWFTYDENGNQAWNLGVGDILANTIILKESLAGKGTKFGNDFNKDEVSREPFSMIALDFNDCNSGNIIYSTHEGEQTGTLPIVHLTRLAGTECESLPGPDDIKKYVMTNASDPVLKRYETPGGMILDLEGVFSNGGMDQTSDGAIVILPSGESIRLTFDPERGVYEAIFIETGVRAVLTKNEDGSSTLTIDDPKSESSWTIPWGEGVDQQINAMEAGHQDILTKDKLDVSRLTRAVDPGDGSTGAVAEIAVEYCGKNTNKAQVDFILGDPAEPSQDPTSASFDPSRVITFKGYPTDDGTGNYLYEGDIPTGLLDIKSEVWDPICKFDPAEWKQFCETVRERDKTEEGLCAVLKHPIAIAVCLVYVDGPAFACDHRAPFCDGEYSRVFQPGLWARITMPGWNYTRYSGFNRITAETTRSALRSFVIPSAQTMIQHSTEPVVIGAGSTYDLKVEMGCPSRSSKLYANRADGSTKTCDVGEDGWCTFRNLDTEKTMVQEKLTITDQGDFSKSLTIKFVSGSDLDIPAGVQPSDGSTVANKCGDDDPTWNFSWSPVPGATGYRIRMRDRDGNVKFEESVNGTEYSYTLSEQVAEEKRKGWFWKVSAKPDGPPANVNIDVSSCSELFALTVEVDDLLGSAPGSVSITDSLGGVIPSCDEKCTYSYLFGTEITLLAQEGNGSEFKEWQGNCSVNPENPKECSLTISKDTTIDAIFDPAESDNELDLSGSWSMTVNWSGGSCEPPETWTVDVTITQEGNAVTLCEPGFTCLEGELNGNSVRWNGTNYDIEVSGTVSSDGNSITGAGEENADCLIPFTITLMRN